MGNLLDKVLDNKDNPTSEQLLAPQDDARHKLEDGSIVYDSTIAAVNRVFEVNPHLYKRRGRGGEYELHNGETKLSVNSELQLMALVKGDWDPKTKYQLAWFKEKVIELAPTVSFDKYLITDDLVWDKDEAKLKRITDNDNIRTIS